MPSFRIIFPPLCVVCVALFSFTTLWKIHLRSPPVSVTYIVLLVKEMHVTYTLFTHSSSPHVFTLLHLLCYGLQGLRYTPMILSPYLYLPNFSLIYPASLLRVLSVLFCLPPLAPQHFTRSTFRVRSIFHRFC